MYRLKLKEDVITTIPTIGFGVETIDFDGNTFTIWDLGGQSQVRSLCNKLNKKRNIVIKKINILINSKTIKKKKF